MAAAVTSGSHHQNRNERVVWRARRKLQRNTGGHVTDYLQHDLGKKKPSSNNGAKKATSVRKKMLRRVQVQKNGRGCPRQPKRTFLLGSPVRHILEFTILEMGL